MMLSVWFLLPLCSAYVGNSIPWDSNLVHSNQWLEKYIVVPTKHGTGNYQGKVKSPGMRKANRYDWNFSCCVKKYNIRKNIYTITINSIVVPPTLSL